jgi:NAD(P)-dependent dehydrogenase (short-subunit alcohol dehydrogenase family)
MVVHRHAGSGLASYADNKRQSLSMEIFPMLSFTGKVALVTGGTQGIGRACALAFAREGAKVVVTGRGADAGQETVRLIKDAGGDANFVRADVSREADVKHMIESTLKSYGRLDFACNNAGIEQDIQPLQDQTEETFDRIMNTNVKGVWLSMKHEIPAMLLTAGGAIVNLTSVAGVIGMSGLDVYVASKHAVIGLTKTAALAFGKSNIRVNAVGPAAIQTPMFDRFTHGDAKMLSAFANLHPIGRIGQPEEVAEAVVWLCSDKASFVTGHTLMVDGGFTAQ